MSSKFVGTGVAMVTPFRRDRSIDFNSLTKLTNHLISNGVEYLVVLGTTGESPALSKDEKLAIVNHVKEVNAGRIPIVLGMGGNNTQDVVNQINEYDFEGIDGILSVAPAYNKPNQRGIYEHFQEIATASPVPVILYNVPSRTSSNISADTTVQLARDFENIVAIKEATSDMNQVTHIAKNKPDDFLLLSGNDNLSLQYIAVGGSGTISVVGNAFPKDFSDMIRLALDGNFVEARKIQFDLLDIIDALFEDGNPGGIKAVLRMMDIVPNHLRLPLVRINKATYSKLQKMVMAKIGAVKE